MVKRISRNNDNLCLVISLSNTNHTLELKKTVRLNYRKQYKNLGVPKQSIFKEAGNNYVIVAQNGKAHKHKVKLGQSSGDFVTTTDLKQGSKIVHSGKEQLKNGDDIIVKGGE